MIRSAFTFAALLLFAWFIAGQAAVAIWHAAQADAEYWER